MKTCSICKTDKPLDEFDMQSTGKLGRRADCKICRKRFNRSIPGLVKSMYGNQVQKSKRRGYQPPTYTEQELHLWVLWQHEFHPMYSKWVASGYRQDIRPSIDRINDYQSYTLENIQLVTHQQNTQRYLQDQKAGVNTKHTLAVDMLDLSGNFIERFYSISEAARRFNGIPSNIVGACTQRITYRKNPDGSVYTSTCHKAYGHKWRYSKIPNDNRELI